MLYQIHLGMGRIQTNTNLIKIRHIKFSYYFFISSGDLIISNTYSVARHKRGQANNMSTIFEVLQKNHQTRNEWVRDYCLTPCEKLFSHTMAGTNFIDKMIMMSTLYKTKTLSWIFIVPANWNNSRLVDMFVVAPLGHIIMTNQFLLLLVNAACLSREATNTNFRVFGLTRPGSTHDLQHKFAVSTLTSICPPPYSVTKPG